MSRHPLDEPLPSFGTALREALCLWTSALVTAAVLFLFVFVIPAFFGGM